MAVPKHSFVRPWTPSRHRYVHLIFVFITFILLNTYNSDNIGSHQYTTINASTVSGSSSTDMPSCLVIFHVPKTGGTSLGRFLIRLENELVHRQQTSGRNESPWTRYNWYSYKSYSSPTQISTTTHTIHTGHYTPKFLDLSHTRHCYKVTILREPIDRVISAFYYYKHKTDEWQSCLDADNTSFIDRHASATSTHPDRCIDRYRYHNDVVRLFSNQTDAWDSYDTEHYANLMPDHSSLLAAKYFLQHSINQVCFLQNLDECISTLRRTFGIKDIVKTNSSHHIRNRNSDRPNNVSSMIINSIADANRLDVELYKWALQEFG